MRSHPREKLCILLGLSPTNVFQQAEGERTGLFLLLSSESAANNPSLVFVINSKSLIYIFQLLDVWIAPRRLRELHSTHGARIARVARTKTDKCSGSKCPSRDHN